MALSAAGVILMTGGMTLVNEALSAPYSQGATPVLKYINWRLVPATGVAALIFAGLEKVNGPIGRGLAWLAFVTALLMPLGSSPSPIVHIAEVLGDTGNTVSSLVT